MSIPPPELLPFKGQGNTRLDGIDSTEARLEDLSAGYITHRNTRYKHRADWIGFVRTASDGTPSFYVGGAWEMTQWTHDSPWLDAGFNYLVKLPLDGAVVVGTYTTGGAVGAIIGLATSYFGVNPGVDGYRDNMNMTSNDVRVTFKREVKSREASTVHIYYRWSVRNRWTRR